MENNFWNKGTKWAFEDMDYVHSRINFEISEIMDSDYAVDSNVGGPLSEQLDNFNYVITRGYIYPLANQLLRVTAQIYDVTKKGQTLQLRDAQVLLNEIRALRYDGYNSAPLLHYLELDL